MRGVFKVVELDGTNRSLKKLFLAFNRAYFGGRLDEDIEIRFSTVKCRSAMAYCRSNEDYDEIVIDKKFRHFRRLTCLLLFHEMNHLDVGTEHGHDKYFERGMLRLAQIGALKGIW
jgi:SprT-like family protein